MPNFITIEGARALDNPDEAIKVQAQRMHKGYQVVDPEPIAERLNRSNFWKARVISNVMRTGDHKKHGWSKLLEVRGMNEMNGAPGYVPVFKALFNHQGRHALKIMPGGIRCECENEFVGEPCWRATHLDREAVDYLTEYPVTLFCQLADKAAEPIRRVESLRGVECHRDWRAVFDRGLPRVGVWVRRAWRDKYSGHVDMWGLLQSLTEIKRAGGQRVSRICLADAGWERAKDGGVPDELMTALAKVDVAAELN